MNPPYGRAIAAWVRKAYEASKAGATVVCLLPSKTGLGWWQDYVIPYAAEIRYLRGRQKFSGKRNTPFDSAVVVFRPLG
jgi:DNA N-6-adenine-methyltransferase (Dam)